MPIVLDDHEDHANWLRTQFWRLPPCGTPEVDRWLRKSATTLEEFKRMPMYRGARKCALIDADDRWTGRGMGWGEPPHPGERKTLEGDDSVARSGDRQARMRCARGHERTIEFYDLAEEGLPVRRVAYVRAALGEAFHGTMDIWRDNGELPRCPCGAQFVGLVSHGVK